MIGSRILVFNNTVIQLLLYNSHSYNKNLYSFWFTHVSIDLCGRVFFFFACFQICPKTLINSIWDAAMTVVDTNLEVLWPISPCAPSAFRPGCWDWTAGGPWCPAACCHSQSTLLQARSAPTRFRMRAIGSVWPTRVCGTPGHWGACHPAPSLRTGLLEVQSWCPERCPSMFLSFWFFALWGDTHTTTGLL